MSRRRAIQQKPTPRPLPAPASIPPWQWFTLAAALPLAICAAKLNLDLWHDEIYTLDVFVAGGPRKIVTDYSLPNNHVFYSLLLWPVHLISDNSFALRLPSFGFAAATIWLTFQLARRLNDLRTGLLAVVLLGLNQMFLIHAMLVRGYSLSMFLFAWLFNLAVPAEGRSRTSQLAQIALAGAAFLYVMPTNVLFFLPLAAIGLAWEAWPPAVMSSANQAAAARHANIGRIAKVAGAWTAAVVLAAACYAPIIQQVLNQRGPQTGYSVASLFELIKNFVTPAQHDFWPLIPLFVLGLIVWIVRRARGLATSSPALPIAAAVCFCTVFALTALLQISPFPRNFCPLLPLIAIIEAWTLGELANAVPWKSPAAEAKTTVAAALLVAAVLAPQLWTYPDRLAAYCRRHPGAHDGYFNYYAANYRPAAVVESLYQRTSNGQPYRIFFSDEDHLNLSYYFQRLGQPLAGGSEAEQGEGWPLKIYIIAPAAADWPGLSRKSGLSEKTLRAFPELAEFGYYRLYGSTGPVSGDHAE